MKTNRRTPLLIILTAMLLLITLPAAMAAEVPPVHLYLNIPFENADAQMVADILLKEKNALFEMNPNGVLSGYACNVEAFGYLFDLTVDFSDGAPQIGYSFETGGEFTRIPPAVERIRLNSLQNARITPEEGQERIPADLRQYVDMCNQLTELYGQPDVQYFKTSRMSGKSYTKFQFAEGRWEAGLMEQAVERDQRLEAYSCWGNVVLKLDVDLGIRYRDVYISGITLYYYPENNTADFLSNNTFEVYPSF